MTSIIVLRFNFGTRSVLRRRSNTISPAEVVADLMDYHTNSSICKTVHGQLFFKVREPRTHDCRLGLDRSSKTCRRPPRVAMDDRNMANHYGPMEKKFKNLEFDVHEMRRPVVIGYIMVLRPPTTLCTYLLRGFWYIRVYMCAIHIHNIYYVVQKSRN